MNGTEICDDGANTGGYASCSKDCSRRFSSCEADPGCQLVDPIGRLQTIRIGECMATLLTNVWALGIASCHPVHADNAPQIVAEYGADTTAQRVPVRRVVRHPSWSAVATRKAAKQRCAKPGIDLALYELAYPLKLPSVTSPPEWLRYDFTEALWPGVSVDVPSGSRLTLSALEDATLECLSSGRASPGDGEVLMQIKRAVKRVRAKRPRAATSPADRVVLARNPAVPALAATRGAPCFGTYRPSRHWRYAGWGDGYLAAVRTGKTDAAGNELAVAITTPGVRRWVDRTLHAGPFKTERGPDGPSFMLARKPGAADIFARAANGLIEHHVYADGRYTSIGALAGLVAADEPPAAGSWLRDHVELFARSRQGAVYWRRMRRGKWGGWSQLSPAGVVDSALAVAVRGPGELYLFAKNRENELVRRALSETGWSEWETVYADPTPPGAQVGRLNSAPFALAYWPRSYVDVWGLDSRGEVVDWWLPQLLTRTTKGTQLRAPPVAARGRFEPFTVSVYGWGKNGNLWHLEYDRVWHHRWLDLGIKLGGPPRAARMKPGVVEVLARDPQGEGLRLIFSSTSDCPLPNRSGTFDCTEAGCGCTQGQGPCANDAQCAGDLVCRKGFGKDLDLPMRMAVCVSPCQGKPCSARCPCADGAGPCRSDSECACGLTCAPPTARAAASTAKPARVCRR